MCVDNPRAGFADMFATHPSIDSRVDALVRMAGGHDPGTLAALPDPDRIEAAARDDAGGSTQQEPQSQGPWSEPQPSPQSVQQNGPWGPVRG